MWASDGVTLQSQTLGLRPSDRQSGHSASDATWPRTFDLVVASHLADPRAVPWFDVRLTAVLCADLRSHVLPYRSANFHCYNRKVVVGIAQLAEHRTVAPTVAGSIPVSHPRFSGLRCVKRFLRRKIKDCFGVAILPAHHGPVAQLDRASVFGTEGWGFESLRGHHFFLTWPGRGCPSRHFARHKLSSA